MRMKVSLKRMREPRFDHGLSISELIAVHDRDPIHHHALIGLPGIAAH
jgi:hypothetical protein